MAEPVRLVVQPRVILRTPVLLNEVPPPVATAALPTDEPARTARPARGATPPSTSDWRSIVLAAGAAVAIAVGIVLRFTTRSSLWLDESLTVEFASLPLTDIPHALRQDGAPPLFYLLLHLWMGVFGDGNVAVRALPAIFGIASLPLIYKVAARLAPEGHGRSAGWGAVLALATNPFAIRYSSEARMYSMVAFEVAVGLALALRLRERPTTGRALALAPIAPLLLYTHYWSLYVLVAIGLMLLARAWRRPDERRVDLLTLGSLVGGCVLWLPWVPTFLFQAAHTGTPWATPGAPAALVNVPQEFAGGFSEGPRALLLLLSAIILLGLFGHLTEDGHLLLQWHGDSPARPLLAVFVGCPAVAIAAGMVSRTAFVARYTSVVLPLFAVLVGIGLGTMGRKKPRAIAVAAMVVLGLSISVSQQGRQRTQAAEIAAYIRTTARPGDVLAYCPDQLGPAIHRILGDGFAQTTFPRDTPPAIVNWIDYAQANAEASPVAFARRLVERAGTHDVWVVSSHGYRTAAKACTEVELALAAVRPQGRAVLFAKPGRYFENGTLLRYPAAE